MDDDLKERADRRLVEALGAAAVRDPRPFFRPLLRHLRERDPAAFERAIRHFREVLVPAAAGDVDPLEAWAAYGWLLAEQARGRTVSVDGAGRASPADASSPGLLLHLPDDDAAPALVLRCPAETTRAQEATLELLVQGRVTASAYD